jgi:hypothetical protein
VLGVSLGIGTLMVAEKISERWPRALSVLVTMRAKGPVGFCWASASVNWIAALIALSWEDRVGIFPRWGKKVTVSPMRSAFVLVT